MPTIDELRAREAKRLQRVYWFARGRRRHLKKQLTYLQTVNNTQSDNLVAYWPLNETTGTTVADQVDSPNQDGTATGVVWNDTTGADGGPVPRFDGVNDVVDVHSSTFSTAFPGDEGSVSILIKVFNASVWTDGALRYGFRFRGNGSNEIRVAKLAGSNSLYFEYKAGATSKDFTHTISTTNWIHIVTTWSDSADEAKLYVDNDLKTTLTAIGTWSASSLEATRTVVGALDNTPSNDVWNGWAQHVAVWSTPLSADDVNVLYKAL